jgi:hypothetical protein
MIVEKEYPMIVMTHFNPVNMLVFGRSVHSVTKIHVESGCRMN